MMSKRNNKGFSLIELIIAVAVLALLVSPIIAQVFQTIQTSSRAKERQYVVDNANLVIEYFKANSIKDLTFDGDKGDAVTISSPPVSTKVNCEIFDDSGDTGVSVTYDVTDYALSNETLGRENNVYSRTVSMDNLSNKLMEKGYDMRYDVASGEEGELELTSDNTAVKYDSNNHIVAVLAKVRTENYIDPNEASLGNIQDIDATKMAIIKGNAIEMDFQFQKSFVGKLVNIVSKKKKQLIANGTYDYYSDTDNLNEAFDSIRQNNDFYRLIKLSVTAKEDGGQPAYYVVRCDVFYKAQYTFLDDSYNDDFSFTVFNQKFYTDESPDVFFIYEPFIKKTDANYRSYAANDYIRVVSDDYTSGANGTDPSKVYLIKADSTWAEKIVEGRAIEASVAAKEADQYFNYYLTESDGTGVPVNINISQIGDTVSPTLPLQIITNISYMNDDGNRTINSDYRSTSAYQFTTNVPTDSFIPSMDLGLNQTCYAYPGGDSDIHGIEEITYPDGSTKQAITYPLDDKRTEGRLYSITVRYDNTTRPTDATLYFTGAKGAD